MGQPVGQPVGGKGGDTGGDDVRDVEGGMGSVLGVGLGGETHGVGSSDVIDVAFNYNPSFQDQSLSSRTLLVCKCFQYMAQMTPNFDVA